MSINLSGLNYLGNELKNFSFSKDILNNIQNVFIEIEYDNTIEKRVIILPKFIMDLINDKYNNKSKLTNEEKLTETLQLIISNDILLSVDLRYGIPENLDSLFFDIITDNFCNTYIKTFTQLFGNLYCQNFTYKVTQLPTTVVTLNCEEFEL